MAKQPKEKSIPKRFHQEVISQMLTLATSGFGLVAALAWNEAVQSFVKQYIEAFFPDSSGIISRFLYAIFITLFAVTITYQLSKLSARLDGRKN